MNNYEYCDAAFTAGNGEDELDFPFPLFTYPHTGNDLPQDDQDDDLSSACPSAAHLLYSELSLSQQSYHQPTSEDALPCHETDLRDLLGHSLPLHSGAAPTQSPRIEITCPDLHHHHRDHVQTAPVDINRRLTVPLYQSTVYRENLVSPASSNSSTSWQSEACSPVPSPSVSPSGGGGLTTVTVAELCPRLQAIHASGSPRTSPTTSPRTSITEETFLNFRQPSSRPGSRSTSPQGKRTYEQYQNPSHVLPRSRSPSPHAGKEEPPELYRPPTNMEEFVDSLNKNLTKPVPTKIVRPNPGYPIYSQTEHAFFPTAQEVKTEPILETLYTMPNLGWSNQLPSGMCSMSVPALHPLEWALPSSVEEYELSIEVQPRQHHRAQYETEGSRGAVKAASGGHPVVQLHGYRGREALALQVFIGTADERAVRPHAFYQVHRITGKTVTTSSHEKIINGTKVLELPLEPKDNMRAIVDCVGMLKLKNADIELRKGETDIGRKNTRVRLVFRVHVPQPGGQWLSLQVSSHPIECSQRSAQEHPAVERQDVDCCSVLGGLQMILTGQNFTSESRVFFTEKTQDGLEVWETEATVDREKSQANMLYVQIPPYRDHNIYHPAKVNFCVLNGKRKRSQPQHFTYMPLSVTLIKAEPVDEYQYGHLGCSMGQVLGISPQSCHHTTQLPTNTCAVTNLAAAASPRSSPTFYPPASEFPLQQNSTLYHSQADVLNNSSCHYQPPLNHCAPEVHSIPQSRANPASHLKPTSYQYAVTAHGYEAAASVFPGLSAPEFVPIVGHKSSFVQRAAPKVGKSPPGQSYSQQQPNPPVQHPKRVTIKQENLDQAYLDDVNEVIRKDLTVQPREQ
ncbi:nuclear factor of activated T-cells, cytoplasmic 2 isoform X2 [Hoplias malabaricus]|uniref:nuclear factor of activated T-cells, cytoplasmic 2 isoform X2 n=1 Tax=Hoplias malabaricus TaxID=27720 RepID=UPI0034635451